MHVLQLLYTAHITKYSKLGTKLLCTMADCNEVIFKTLDSVLNHLKNDKYKNLSDVKTLLNIYEEVKATENSTGPKNYPLIVLEGLDGCGKSTATKMLVEKIKGTLFCTPPPCIRNIRDNFDSPEYKDVRTAYYALGNYIAAIQIKNMLNKQPVILDRFWHSTAAYAIAQAIADYPERYNLPTENDQIYEWPADLLMPDLTLFLNVGERVRLLRLKNRPNLTEQEHLLKEQAKFRSNVLEVYKRIKPNFILIDGEGTKSNTLRQILDLANPLLQQKEAVN